MSRNGAGVYSLPPSYLAETGDTILADQHNSPLEDLQTDANTPRPIVAGGTGASSAVSARTNLSVMSVADIQSGYVPKVATKAALSALDTASFKAAVLTETTREKLWMWKSGDFSAEEAADTDNVNYIPADGVSTSLGCWVAATGDGVTVRTIAAGGTGADNAADARTNLGLKIGTDVQAHSAVLDATTASFTTAQKTKLSGIETGADVTSATNVNAAGAVMNTDTATTDMQFVIDEDDMASDSATKVPTQQSVKARGDNRFAADRTALAGMPLSQYDAVYLREAGREGWFKPDGSDLSTYVTADTQQGIYVAPSSDTTGASGAWVRVYNGPADLAWWGAVGDGVIDDAPAFSSAKAVGERHWRGRPGAVYRHVGQFVIPDEGLDFDLNGSTWAMVTTNTMAISGSAANQSVAAIIEPTIPSYPLKEFTLASSPPAEFVAGAFVWFLNSGAGGGYPVQARTIESVVGTTVTLDRDVTYPIYGTDVSLGVVDWHGAVRIYNGTLDLSETTTSGLNTEGGILIRGAETVDVHDVEFVGVDWNNSDPVTENDVVAAEFCRTVQFYNNKAKNLNTGEGVFLIATNCVKFIAVGNEKDGHGYGIQCTNADSVFITDNKVAGNWRSLGTQPAYGSIRGISVRGTMEGIVQGNTVRDFNTGLKNTEVGGTIVSGNRVDYCKDGINFSSSGTPTSLWSENAITGNVVRDSLEIGILINDAARHILVSENIVRNSGHWGIYNNAEHTAVHDNIIYFWGMESSADTTTWQPIRINNSAAKGAMFGNWAYAASSGQPGYYIHSSASAFKFGDNFVQNKFENQRYYNKPTPSATMRTELGQGLILQHMSSQAIGTSNTTINLTEAFQGGTISAWATPRGATTAEITLVGVAASTVTFKASAAVNADIFAIGY